MNTLFKKRTTGFYLLITMILSVLASTTTAADEALTVYKNPGCGCCSAWADRMKDAGFSVSVTERSAQNVDAWQVGIQAEHQSCHSRVFRVGHGAQRAERRRVAGWNPGRTSVLPYRRV